MHLFFSVGEPSGDQHAAHLIQELRKRHPDLHVSGFGGEHMEAVGLESLYRLTNMAVMGFVAVFPLLWRFIKLARKAEKFLNERRPDAVILVDFPGFNWSIARRAKAAGIPVFYYLPPQLWAWCPWRVKRVQRWVDHVISTLPFERDWYSKHGVAVEYVGHPFFDDVATRPLDARFVETWSHSSAPIVGILPGSRNQEIAHNWPLQLDIIQRLHARHPKSQFLVACYKDSHRRSCESHMLANAPTLPIHFFVGRTSEIIQMADCALMVSGSVCLEVLARKTPAVVLYRTSWPNYVLGKWLVVIKYMSLPNLIADRLVMPEFLSVGNFNGVADEALKIVALWLRVPAERARTLATMTEAVGDFPATGATVRAAEFISKKLGHVDQPAEQPAARAA